MSIVIVVGTRPEVIKMAPVIKELEKRGTELFTHTGQAPRLRDEQDLPAPSR